MTKLLPQTKQMVKDMEENGYPICLGRTDWNGKYPRHCNACINSYKYENNNKICTTNTETKKQ